MPFSHTPALGNALSCPLIHEIRAASGMPDLLDYSGLMITGPFLLIAERGMYGMVRLCFDKQKHDKCGITLCVRLILTNLNAYLYIPAFH